jgi:hypothetical protein
MLLLKLLQQDLSTSSSLIATGNVLAGAFSRKAVCGVSADTPNGIVQGRCVLIEQLTQGMFWVSVSRSWFLWHSQHLQSEIQRRVIFGVNDVVRTNIFPHPLAGCSEFHL